MNDVVGHPYAATLATASVDETVTSLRPDYRAVLVAVSGVRGGPTDSESDEALRRAEDSARARLAGSPPESMPEVAAWREAFAAFGVKPRQARSSVEALLRRVEQGLPRIDRLTDLYNAISIEHLVPIGGEDIARYVGAPRLVRALGNESFDTVVDGRPAVVPPEAGEVVWCDDAGVTCRRWNWRQCVRTRLGEDTTDVLFIVDGLQPVSSDALQHAAAQLIDAVTVDVDASSAITRMIGADA